MVLAGALGVSLWKQYTTAEKNNPVTRCLCVKCSYQVLYALTAWAEITFTVICSVTEPAVQSHTGPLLNCLD